jgi:peptide/nickel transport system permease protein
MIRRILYSGLVLLVASFLLFAFVRATFDPTARLRTSRDTSVIARERERLGLNDSVLVQYKNWLSDAIRGDFGTSSRTNEEVSSMISRAMGNTLQLILWGIGISAVVAIGIGVFSAIRQYSIPDYLFTGVSYLGIAMPPFWFGLIAIEIFAVRLGWFKFMGLHSGDSTAYDLDYLQHLVLPVATLCVQIVASWSRFQRASMLDVMSADYVRTARAKGVPRRRVIFKHGLRNALVPLVTVMALDTAAHFGGLIITERIFSIAGMGRMFYDALLTGDVYVVEAWMVVVAFFIIIFNLFADMIYSILDPRIRLS